MGAGSSGPTVENCSGRDGDILSRKGTQRKGEVPQEVLTKRNKYASMEMAQWVTRIYKHRGLSSDPSTHRKARQAQQCTSATLVPGGRELEMQGERGGKSIPRAGWLA